MEGYYINQGLPAPENPDWGLITNMLLAAKFYE